jgi:hypothetical protein
MDNEITANDISENGLPNNKILKYHTSLMLKDIYYKEKNYLQSLYYYDLARYKYTWGLGRCGMMSPYLTEEEIYRFTCYEGTGRNSLAIETILFKILTNESVDTNLVKRLVDLLYKNNNNEYLKIELTSNINNIEDTDAVNGRIKFMNNYLYVFDLQQIWQLSTEEKAIKIKEKIQNHLFYKLIMEN